MRTGPSHSFRPRPIPFHRFAAVILLLPAALLADEYRFEINRFGSIQLTTGKEGAKAVLIQGNKQGEEVTWQGALKAVDKETFVTKGGVTFKLVKLAKKVVKDPNRGINSGSWKLTISGKGKDYEALKKEMVPVAFGEGDKTECFGEKVE